MCSIVKAIKKQHFEAMERHESWDFTYWAFDLHGSIVIPNYETGNIPTEMYPYAEEVLKMLSNRNDIVMFLYTCSHPHEQIQYMDFFRGRGIDFKYVNKNPEVKTQQTGYGYYKDKPYFNILIEDKAGFDPETDWLAIKQYMKNK